MLKNLVIWFQCKAWLLSYHIHFNHSTLCLSSIFTAEASWSYLLYITFKLAKQYDAYLVYNILPEMSCLAHTTMLLCLCILGWVWWLQSNSDCIFELWYCDCLWMLHMYTCGTYLDSSECFFFIINFVSSPLSTEITLILCYVQNDILLSVLGVLHACPGIQFLIVWLILMYRDKILTKSRIDPPNHT